MHERWRQGAVRYLQEFGPDTLIVVAALLEEVALRPDAMPARYRALVRRLTECVQVTGPAATPSGTACGTPEADPPRRGPADPHARPSPATPPGPPRRRRARCCGGWPRSRGGCCDGGLSLPLGAYVGKCALGVRRRSVV
ncbi:hypothetical protein Acsp05_39250 [Actinokineospora sp. NBRC 105648]|nr:hypothetical protein Acsp05_39250 [Actinokineospora sp. NBRC 105648]